MSDSTVARNLATTLLAVRERCARQAVAGSVHAGLSARLPGGNHFLFLAASSAEPRLESWLEPTGPLSPTLHAAVYRLRPDVGAVLSGGGRFAAALRDFGGTMPVAFDEQARHLGRMPAAAATESDSELQPRLSAGTNTLLLADLPVCLGTTCQRLALNIELFEKCAKAYVLATATGRPVTTLPWWVCHIAIGRLRKDQRRAAQRFAQGLLPEEARGY